MEATSNSSSATLLLARLADYVQLRQDDNGQSSVDPNGPYGKFVSQIHKAFEWFEQASADQQTSSDSQASMMASSVPTPYSTDAIPADVQSDPMSQIQPEDVARMQDFSTNSPMMTSALRVADDPGTGGGGQDLRSTTGGTPIVRDHRHAEGTPRPSAPPIWYPPAAPPPRASVSQGTSFTSAADYDKLNSVNDSFQSAKQAALDDPTDPAKQLQFQEAAQALQLLTSMLTQVSSMFASIAENAIKSSRVNAG